METKYFPQLTFNYGTVNRQRRVLLSNGDPDTHNPGLLIFKTAGDKTCGMAWLPDTTAISRGPID